MSTSLSTSVPIAEAARLSNVSTKTIRRWIKRGHLSVDTRGRAHRVVLSEVMARAGGQHPHDVDTTVDSGQHVDSPTVDTSVDLSTHLAALRELVGLVERAQADAREHAAVAAMWQERARVLSEQLALMAPQSPVEARQAPPPVDVALGPSTWLSWRYGRGRALVTMTTLAVAVLVAMLLLR